MLTREKIGYSDLVETGADASSGAVVTFAGVVRADAVDGGGRRVDRIFYESYDSMARSELASIVEEAESRSDVHRVSLLHRTGDVPAGDISLLVVVSSGHRAAAFATAAFVVEQIKKRVPIWKKEIYDDGSSRWQ